jgi:hypothetical protein
VIITTPAEFVLVYDLRDPAAGQRARRHRRYWGRLYTDLHVLDERHVALVFHSGGARWLPWEERRKKWILDREAA